MGRENLVRCTCERCEAVEEIQPNIFKRHPSGWKKIQNRLLCGRCSNDFEKNFRRFMKHEN
jgi:hypothetical protein